VRRILWVGCTPCPLHSTTTSPVFLGATTIHGDRTAGGAGGGIRPGDASRPYCDCLSPPGTGGQAREGLALALSASAMDIGYALLAAFASSALVGALRGLVTDNAW